MPKRKRKDYSVEYFLYTIPEGIEQEGIALHKTGVLWVKNPNSGGAVKLTKELAGQLRDALNQYLMEQP